METTNRRPCLPYTKLEKENIDQIAYDFYSHWLREYLETELMVWLSKQTNKKLRVCTFYTGIRKHNNSWELGLKILDEKQKHLKTFNVLAKEF